MADAFVSTTKSGRLRSINVNSVCMQACRMCHRSPRRMAALCCRSAVSCPCHLFQGLFRHTRWQTPLCMLLPLHTRLQPLQHHKQVHTMLNIHHLHEQLQKSRISLPSRGCCAHLPARGNSPTLSKMNAVLSIMWDIGQTMTGVMLNLMKVCIHFLRL